jgi:predicted outer membrane protein
LLILQELSSIAPQQAYNNNLVQFTQKNYEMHEKIVDQLEDVADDINIKLPEQPSPMYQSHLTILRSTEQENFDDEFIDFVSRVDENVYRDYKDAAVNADNEEVRVLAARFISFQRESLNQINNLAVRVNDAKKG